MAIQLNLKPEIESLLIAQAAAKGISVEQYLEFWIGNNLTSEIERSFDKTATTAEWVDAFTTWAKSHSSKAPPLSDESISRESIYGEREDYQR